MNEQQFQNNPAAAILMSRLRQGLWFLCIPAWLFGAAERGVTVFSHSAISMGDFLQVLTAAFFLLGWLLLKPTPRFSNEGAEG